MEANSELSVLVKDICQWNVSIFPEISKFVLSY